MQKAGHHSRGNLMRDSMLEYATLKLFMSDFSLMARGSIRMGNISLINLFLLVVSTEVIVGWLTAWPSEHGAFQRGPRIRILIPLKERDHLCKILIVKLRRHSQSTRLEIVNHIQFLTHGMMGSIVKESFLEGWFIVPISHDSPTACSEEKDIQERKLPVLFNLTDKS
ncbi:hypothetical protein ABEB36_014809 [Hypothenemus hampei]|uniref:Uncharacterized protein n=1 Tax=Hypothenemus hampei TaxID=57062 RepID=A0ABD1E0Z6_HYPHA